jgi:hypothetical protein
VPLRCALCVRCAAALPTTAPPDGPALAPAWWRVCVCVWSISQPSAGCLSESDGVCVCVRFMVCRSHLMVRLCVCGCACVGEQRRRVCHGTVSGDVEVRVVVVRPVRVMSLGLSSGASETSTKMACA